jgi:hypothetical protein
MTTSLSAAAGLFCLDARCPDYISPCLGLAHNMSRRMRHRRRPRVSAANVPDLFASRFQTARKGKPWGCPPKFLARYLPLAIRFFLSVFIRYFTYQLVILNSRHLIRRPDRGAGGGPLAF